MPPKRKKAKTKKQDTVQGGSAVTATKPVAASKLEYEEEHGWMQLKELQRSVISFCCYERLDLKGMKVAEQEEKPWP